MAEARDWGEPGERLAQAIRSGIAEQVSLVIEAQPQLRTLLNDPLPHEAFGGTALLAAVNQNNREMVDALLREGAAIDARDSDHESTAAQYMVRDRQEIARSLVARGCRTDILMAAALGDLDRVRQHLEAEPETIRMDVSEEWFPKQDERAGGHIYI